MPTFVDFAYLIFFAGVLTLFEHFVWFPRFRAEVSAGVPGARRRAYRRATIGQWAVTLGAAIIWFTRGRTASDLRLSAPSGWRFVVGLAIGAAAIAFVVVQLISIRRAKPSDLAAARPRLQMYEFILPHTPVDLRWFIALSFTAGFCEEFLYRGYLAWVLHWWLGWTGGVAVGVALFGVAHMYQGKKGAFRATLAGVVMGIIFLTTQWLVPAMILHALIDFGSGVVGYTVFRDAPDAALQSSAD
ncbi:MAG TPA: type II CAAX endopeptidase family protein [Gemmatimonadaceae bacterium]